MALTDGNSSKALGADVAAALYSVNGAGLKIGIISDSYNNLNGAAQDTSTGNLPPTVTVLSDLAGGGSDEGRAMIELAYKIAPGASYYFATGNSAPGSSVPSIQTCANAVAALQAAGCNIIIDDLGFGTDEAFYQTGTVLDNAISTAVAAGVDYFSAAGNDDKAFYEHGFTPFQAAIPNIGAVTANDFGNGNPYLRLTIPTGASVSGLFEWAQPFATIGTSGKSAQDSLGIYLLDDSGNVVARSDVDQVGDNPTQFFKFTNNSTSTSLRLVVVQNGGVVPAGQLFKLLFSNGNVTINDPNADTGSGNIYGHELLTNQNSVAAVAYAQTPAFGVSPAVPVDFTSVGPGTILFDSQGNPLTSPASANQPNFAGAQGSNTAVPGFAPFNGTSAAAPNDGAVAALALQTNRTLSTTQLTSILTQSAIPVSTTLPDAGAGLIQARASVELAAASAGDRWNTAAGGDWSVAANWSGGALPTTAQAAMLDDNLGAFNGSYTVTVSTTGEVAGSLTVGTPSGSAATLVIAPGGQLTIGGSNAANPTANDFLVSNNGKVSVQGGMLTVAGSLNVNNGATSIATGNATADNVAENAGTVAVGGGASAAVLALSGGGWNETGGTASILANGSLGTTKLTVSSSSFTVATGGAVSASGAANFTSNAIFSDAGSFMTAAALSLDSTVASVLSNAALAAATLAVSATVTGFTGALTVAGALTDAGALTASSAANAGRIVLQSGGTLSIGGAASNVGIAFSGGGKLVFNSTDSTVLTTGLTSVLSGFNNGASTVDFTGLTYDASDSYTYNNGALSIVQNSTGGTLADLALNPTDNYSMFQVAADANNHVLVKAVPCYCRGTLIETARGDVAVENLQIGDLLRTHRRGLRPIVWIGRRAYLGHFVAGNPDVLPVRIRASALQDGVPRRDLLVSPLHALFLDGQLIPASALVNGTSIVQLEAVDQVEYFHIELETHDVILAEGAPAETFVDDDSRGMFQNASECRALYPDAPRVAAAYCAPRVEDGAALERVRHRLAARAVNEAVRPQGALRGRLDEVSRTRITGWAYDAESLGYPVRLRILDQGRVLTEITADRYRADLEAAGIGNGRHAFHFVVPGGLSPMERHAITVECVSNGQMLPNTPWMLEPMPLAEAAPLAVTCIGGGTLRGHLDTATRERITGWVTAADKPDAPVALQVLIDGAAAARVVANQLRPDLVAAGIGNGRHGFDISLPGGLSPLTRHVIQIQREEDGADLPGSPFAIEAADSFSGDLEQAVTQAVGGLDDPASQARALSFMLTQAERLRQMRADADAGRTERTARQQSRRRWGRDAAATAPRALVIDERTPLAGYDAGSQAVLSHMRALQRLGYAVSFVAADEMMGATARPGAAAALDAMGVACCGLPFYSSVESLLRQQASCFDVVYLHRQAIASRYMALARAYGPSTRILYSVADLHHLRLERQAAVEGSSDVLATSRAMRMVEYMAAWSADSVLTHSTFEAGLLRRAVPQASVHVVPWDSPAKPRPGRFAGRGGVAFIGHYAHAPNEDAARWLVDTVMPLVWQADPAIPCLLVGSAMPPSLRRFGDPRIEALGHVEELNAVLDRVRLTVAPLRYGAGIKGKVLASLKAGVPCIMSPVAAEGLDLPPALQSLVGRDAAEIAALIVERHNDRKAHATTAKAGVAFMREGWSADAVTAALQCAIAGQRPALAAVA